jgi:predicted amidophosphoribosyltransferase
MSKVKVKLAYRLIPEIIEKIKKRIIRISRGFDYLIPVPPDPKRLKQRGFNQSKLIVDAMSEYTKTPVIKALRKERSTPHQMGKTRNARLLQDKNIYSLRHPKIDTVLKNKRVLLVDDVCTTGSTIKNCAFTLKATSPKLISGFVLFRGKKIGVNTPGSKSSIEIDTKKNCN